MAKNNKVDLGCAQLRGSFVLSGKVTGRFSNNFYSEGTGQNGNDWRSIRFGVEIEPDKIVYVEMFGSVQDNVYFSKTTKGSDGKNHTETKSVRWADRMKSSKQLFGEDGYRIIGVTCGCKKIIDSKGKEVNDSKHLTMFDACDEVGNLSDGDSVFIRGNITYSTYNDQHRVKFEPVQISLLRQEIDFDAVDFQPNAQFTQPIVCMGVVKNEDTPGEAIVNAKIVNYQSIEDTELYTRNAALAKNLKKLGQYVCIKVFGDIIVDGQVEEAVTSSEWGTPNKMERIASPFKRKLLITGADPDTIDKETYSEKAIEHAMEIIAGIKNAKSDYGKKEDKNDDGWGSSQKSNFDDEEDDDFDLGI